MSAAALTRVAALATPKGGAIYRRDDEECEETLDVQDQLKIRNVDCGFDVCVCCGGVQRTLPGFESSKRGDRKQAHVGGGRFDGDADSFGDQ